MKSKQLARYYLESYIASLPNFRKYTLLEELNDGAIITHLFKSSLKDLKDYVRKVWIDSSPPKFIIKPCKKYGLI